MGKFLLSLFCLLAVYINSTAADIVLDVSKNTNNWMPSGSNASEVEKEAPDGLKIKFGKDTYFNTQGYLFIKQNGYVSLSLPIACREIVLTTTGGQGANCSISVKVGTSVVAGPITMTKNSDHKFSIPAESQGAGTVYQIANTSSASKNAQITKITFKEAQVGPVSPAYSNVPADGEFKMAIGESKSLPEITPTELSYSFSTADTGIIEIDNATKTVKALGKGTATVSFTTEAVADKYLAGEGSFQVTVSGKPAEISFQHRNVEGKLGTGVVWQTAIVKEPVGAAIKYTATDPNSGEVSDVLRIDETTGVINPDDILKVGSALITAATAATDEYEEGKATYIITISDPNSAESPTTTTTIDFTKAGAYGLTTYASSNTSSYATEEAQKTEAPVSFTLEGRYMLKYESGTSGATLLNLPRLTSNGSAAGEITISVPTGGTENAIITRIIFVGGTNLDKLSSDTEGGTYSGENHRWDVTEGQEVSSVHFKNTGNSAANIQKIEVLWQSKNSNLKPAQLSFPQKIYNAEEGIEFEANAVTTLNAVGEISYKIDDCPNGSVVENDGKLKITIPEVGSYTLKATSEENAEFRSGLAIMRINVFPKLTPIVENGTFTDNEIKSESNVAYAKFDVNPQLRLYYLVSETVLDTPDVNDFDEYDTTTGIELSGEGNLYYYLGNFGYNSPIKTVKYNVGPTSVVEIATDADGAVRTFDLNGREIKGTPEKGVYIRIQNGKATKVLVK